MTTKSLHYFFYKLLHWEYWPQSLIYAPIFPVYLYYSAKAGTPFFNVAANPSMENGGYMMESKFTIYKQLPQHLIPTTILVAPLQDFDEAIIRMTKAGIHFPCYCKPDIGGKGKGVVKIFANYELLHYHSGATHNYLIQQEIPYTNEIGVFYCRLPNQPAGIISGIVGKINMEIEGDGKSSVKELIDAVPRYYFQRKFLYTQYKNSLNSILPVGKKMTLLEVGNHARGAEFSDMSNMNSPKLEKLIDTISMEYGTFYFGRYDIKFKSWEDLYEGKNFMIIELNGSGSEPTHIYDPSKSIFKAWKIILFHWKMMYKIAAYNHQKGIPYLSLTKGLALQKEYKKLEKNQALRQ